MPNYTFKKPLIKHGLSRTPTYRAWLDMRYRCRNPNNKAYKNYGGRGITVCKEWNESFAAFLADMGECPEGLSLNRQNNELGYFKDNCRWTTVEVQQRNKRNNIYINYEGIQYTRTELAVKFNLEPNTLKWRLQHGWNLDRALKEQPDYA